MHWLLQHNLSTDEQRERFVKALDHIKALGATWSFITLVPFSGEVRDDPQGPETGHNYTGRKVFALGSTSLILASSRYHWNPGVIYNPLTFRFEAWRNGWGADNLLNGYGDVVRFGDLQPREDVSEQVFIRPCEDLKAFSGHVTDWHDLIGWKKRVLEGEVSTRSLQLTADTMVVVSEPRVVLREWRLFVVGNRVISGSQYRSLSAGPRASGNHVVAGVPEDVMRFARRMVTRWGPAEHYVLDIGETRNGLFVIEANCLNGSGVYASDLEAVFGAIETYYEW